VAAGLIVAVICISAGGRAFAQGQNQPSQGNSQDPQNNSQDHSSQGQAPDAPQPQKKPAAKPKDAQDPSSANSSSSGASSDSSEAPASAPAKDENPFPEAVSQKAAQPSSDAPTPSEAPPSAPAKDENPFPEAVSQKAAQSSPDAPAPSPQKKPSASAENPFPEDVSRSAAKGSSDSSTDGEDSQKHEGQAQDQLPPGVSSSRSSDEGDQDGDTDSSLPGMNEGGEGKNPLAVTDPARAKKDTQVGSFYMQTGDYRGAYQRYKDALRYDPSNADAIFGLAEAAKGLKLVAEAEQNYRLYLEIVPDGSKAKEALKALHALDSQR
jgi:tetratricopeptide (TPR) repeat protein